MSKSIEIGAAMDNSRLLVGRQAPLVKSNAGARDAHGHMSKSTEIGAATDNSSLLVGRVHRDA